MANDELARFTAHFDSECDRCFVDIWQGDLMSYDKIEDWYLCDRCTDEISFERIGDEDDGP